jgi:imidazole glycerol-phosphate synthase subunit HisF
MTTIDHVISTAFEPIPSLDLLDGRAVRLTRGDFRDVTVYGDPLDLAASWDAPARTPLHVVDLDGARSGNATHFGVVRALADAGFRVQVGGGIRSPGDAQRWIDAGAESIVVGTTAAVAPQTFTAIVGSVGAHRVIAAVDLREGSVRTNGWTRTAAVELHSLLRSLEDLGLAGMLVTDIQRDGTFGGPALELYRELSAATPLDVIASGGVAGLGDITSLARIERLRGVVIGKALHERRFTLAEARARAAASRSLCDRVIPCLDVRGGRVVKGTRFTDLRDTGDPVECARRYEAEGADELVVLDISATAEERNASLDVVRAISESLFIPLTVGGGVRSVEDFRTLIQTGADRVAINTAAVQRPALLSECAEELGTQAVVLACDARRTGDGYQVVTHAGGAATTLDAAEWCRTAEQLGAGEILLTSIDRDGTRDGFDLELLRRVSGFVRIGVIASGGAGKEIHFADALEIGGARAVLAASLFHERRLSIGDVKRFLSKRGVPVR